MRRRRPDRWDVLAAAVLALAAWLYLHRLDVWLIDDDEEGYLYAAWRISQGALPYQDFLTPQLPAFLFPGAAVVRLFGNDPWPMRAWSAALTLAAGGATYATGRRLFGPVAGVVALGLLLAIDDVFAIARVFRPESMMLALGAVGLYVFVRADEDGRRGGYAVASLCFGAALLAKLFGILPWLATLAFVIGEALGGVRGRRGAIADLLALGLPGALLVGAVMGGFLWLTPETYTAVLGHHLMQGRELTRWQVIVKNIEFYWRTLNWHAALIAALPLGILAARRLAPRRGWLVVWQLPTILAFLVLSRQLWARHLVYLLPATALIFGAGVAWVVRALGSERRMAAVVAATLAGMVAGPHLLEDIGAWEREEIGTARLAALVRALAPPGTQVLADYPGVGFYAGRTTTYSGAGLSEGATESGQITGAKLLSEMRAGDVAVVLIDQYSQGGHLVDLRDYDAFEAALARDYAPLGKFYRQYQPHAVYARGDIPRPAVDFGWATLVAFDRGAAGVASGGTLGVTAVLQTRARPDRPYTAFLHLVGPDGTTWGQGDALLDNALYRATDEWEVGEVVAVPLDVKVEPGTPPGRYHLKVGLYDRATGARLPWTAPDQGQGDAWDAGEVRVREADEPPDPGSAAFRAAFAGDDVRWVDAPVGKGRLLALRMPTSGKAGDSLALRLTWRVDEALSEEHRISVRLGARDGRTIGEAVVPPAGPDFPWSHFRRGEIITTRVEVLIDPSAPRGPLDVAVAWTDATGSSVGAPMALGTVDVVPLDPPVTTLPALPRRLADAKLGDAIHCLGSDLPATARPGERLAFTLYWRADETPRTAYTVLVHLARGPGLPLSAGSPESDEPPGAAATPTETGGAAATPATAGAPEIAAQADGPPSGGGRPTTSWRRGEVIADGRTLVLPPDLAPGTYDVLVGLYDAGDPAYPRLAVTLDGAPRADGRVPIGSVTVGP